HRATAALPEADIDLSIKACRERKGYGLPGGDPPLTHWPPSTAFRTIAAAESGSSCSQKRSTIHPAARSCLTVSASRRRFAWIFSAHQEALAFGLVPCCGH